MSRLPTPTPPRPIGPVRTVAWWAVVGWVQRAFPGVPSLTTQALADWLSEGNAPLPILLDVRREYEFAVSHLPGAHRTPNREAALALALDPRQPIVAYCSVGYRSARLVAQLRQAGYTQVYNLEGSIFRWANEGQSLVSQGQPVAVVHPFNPIWGLLLRPGLAVQPPQDTS